MRTALIALALASLATAARAESPDVLAIVVSGAGLPEDLDEDVGEPLAFTLGKEADRHFAFLPLEQARTALGYEGATSPGSCVFDSECLRKTRKQLGAARFIVVRLTAAGSEVELTVTRVTDAQVSDVSRTQRTPIRASEIINAARGLVLAVLEEKKATLVLTVNEADAIVTVGGAVLPAGKTRLEVAPGTYTVSVAKPEFVAFETSITCRAGEQCAVSASIFPVQKVQIPTEADPTLSRSLIISGWSAAGVGAVLTAVGIIYGLDAKNLEDELEASCAGQICDITRDEADSKREEGRQAARIFNGAGITGAVLLVAGITTAAVGHAIAPDFDASVDISPAYVPGGAGILTTVRF